MVGCGRRGCPRTALEIGRLLLSLDPTSDPMHTLLHMDAYALKAADETDETQRATQRSSSFFSTSQFSTSQLSTSQEEHQLPAGPLVPGPLAPGGGDEPAVDDEDISTTLDPGPWTLDDEDISTTIRADIVNMTVEGILRALQVG